MKSDVGSLYPTMGDKALRDQQNCETGNTEKGIGDYPFS